MTISSSGLPTIDNSAGSQVYSAALAKSQQKMDGQVALTLIQSAQSPTVSQPSASSVTATLGQNVNVQV